MTEKTSNLRQLDDILDEAEEVLSERGNDNTKDVMI